MSLYSAYMRIATFSSISGLSPSVDRGTVSCSSFVSIFASLEAGKEIELKLYNLLLIIKTGGAGVGVGDNVVPAVLPPTASYDFTLIKRKHTLAVSPVTATDLYYLWLI